MNKWQDITKGSNWRHKKTGKGCIVVTNADGSWDFAQIFHESSGRITRKRVHYFLYEYEKVTE